MVRRVLALSIPFLHLSSSSSSSISQVGFNQHRNTSTLSEKMKQTTEGHSNEINTQQSADNAAAAGAASSDVHEEIIETQITESYGTVFSTITSSLKWCPTSSEELAKAESELLSSLSRPFKEYFVDIGDGWGIASNKIRTLEMISPLEETKQAKSNGSKIANNSEIQKRQPLVMVHGFAAGIGTWILNLDPLSETIDRKVYAIDVLGFARSTRAPFDLSGEASDVEDQFLDSIERWRCKMGLDKIIMLGHSFGGYLCASYALKHPEHVSHVILADPWGIQDRQVSPNRNTYRFPIWVRVVNSIFQSFNPLAVLRASGPYGPSLVHKFRPDLKEKFRPKLQDNCHKFLNYIYHCNAQKATGESAFKALALPYGWPKNPLIHRLLELNELVSLTFIYGSRSWIEKAPGEFLRDCLAPGRVTVNIILNSGHHVYADKFAEFNDLVREACGKIDG